MRAAKKSESPKLERKKILLPEVDVLVSLIHKSSF